MVVLSTNSPYTAAAPLLCPTISSPSVTSAVVPDTPFIWAIDICGAPKEASPKVGSDDS